MWRAQSQAVSPVPSARNYAGGLLVEYPDPDIIASDKRFQRYIVGNMSYQKALHGNVPVRRSAWNGVVVLRAGSDIPNVQMRRREEENTVSVFAVLQGSYGKHLPILRMLAFLRRIADAASRGTSSNGAATAIA